MSGPPSPDSPNSLSDDPGTVQALDRQLDAHIEPLDAHLRAIALQRCGATLRS
jgi:hypothetical protein